jgi:hypothetical protein
MLSVVVKRSFDCGSISWLFYGGRRVIKINQIGYHVISGCKEIVLLSHGYAMVDTV